LVQQSNFIQYPETEYGTFTLGFIPKGCKDQKTKTCGDLFCVASSIWRWRVSVSPIGSQCLSFPAQNSDWSWNFLLIIETVLGLVVPILYFQKGASKFYCMQLFPSSNIFFVLKDHLKDVDSFIIFQVLIFYLNLI